MIPNSAGYCPSQFPAVTKQKDLPAAFGLRGLSISKVFPELTLATANNG